MEMTAAEWWSAIGQTALVVAISFVVLLVITSLVRFQLIAEAATEAKELGNEAEKGFRLLVMNQMAKARKARQPLTVMLLRHPLDGAPAADVRARLKSSIRSTDTVMACGDTLTGILLLCGSDKANIVVTRIMSPGQCGALAGAAAWKFGVAGYPEHGFKTSEIYARALGMIDEAEKTGRQIAGMAAPEEVAEDKSAPADMVDPLTGLVREEKMINTMRRYIAQARRVDQPASLAYVQIDQFTKLVEQVKEDSAQQVVKEVAALMDGQFRESDLLCRFGPGAFVVGLGVGPAEAVAVIQRVANVVRRQVFRVGAGTKVTVSAGIAGYPDVQGTAVQYFVAAEAALRQANVRGRNQIVCYTPSMQIEAPPEAPADRL